MLTYILHPYVARGDGNSRRAISVAEGRRKFSPKHDAAYRRQGFNARRSRDDIEPSAGAWNY